MRLFQPPPTLPPDSKRRRTALADALPTLGVVIVALITKIIGCGLAAKICKFNWADSLKVGVGMMTRGEVALIVAQKGLGVG